MYIIYIFQLTVYIISCDKNRFLLQNQESLLPALEKKLVHCWHGKKSFPYVWKPMHSSNMCWTLLGRSQPTHFGLSSSLRRQEFVKRVCPILRRVSMTTRAIWSKKTRSGFTCFNLLFITEDQFDWNFSQIYLCTWHLMSVAGNLKFVAWLKFNACLASLSASSLPVMPTWLGNQQQTMRFSSSALLKWDIN